MQAREWWSYRSRLLQAGLGYRWVNRHLQELRDHYDDLLLQECQQKQDRATATIRARARLGALGELATKVIESTRPTLLHRRPLLVATLLPGLAYWLSCAVLTLLVIGVGSLGAFFNEAEPLLHKDWLEAMAAMALLLQLYVVLPLAGIALAREGIRNHLPEGYWLAGVILLCVMGSGTRIMIGWPEPAIPNSGYVGMIVLYPGMGPLGALAEGNFLRLCVNLLVTGLAAHLMLIHERSCFPAAEPASSSTELEVAADHEKK